jgi:hypothetical protein
VLPSCYCPEGLGSIPIELQDRLIVRYFAARASSLEWAMRTKVFIPYSRNDLAFVDRLEARASLDRVPCRDSHPDANGVNLAKSDDQQ